MSSSKIYKDDLRKNPYLFVFLCRNLYASWAFFTSRNKSKDFSEKRNRGWLVSNTAVKEVRLSQDICGASPFLWKTFFFQKCTHRGLDLRLTKSYWFEFEKSLPLKTLPVNCSWDKFIFISDQIETNLSQILMISSLACFITNFVSRWRLTDVRC